MLLNFKYKKYANYDNNTIININLVFKQIIEDNICNLKYLHLKSKFIHILDIYINKYEFKNQIK